MEFGTEREAALYDRLKQVLCHAIVTQRLAYPQALAAYVPVLGFQLWMMRETHDDVPPLIDHAVTALHAQQQAYTQTPLPGFADWRVCLALFAEVLAMARLDAGGQGWDIEGFIEDLWEQLPPWIDYWELWAGQSHASGQEDAL